MKNEYYKKDRLNKTNTRTEKIPTIKTIKKNYDDIVQCYLNELYTDVKDMEDTWFEKYYKPAYKEMIKYCNEFIGNDSYKPNIPFEHICELYNRKSQNIDIYLKLNDEHITKDMADYRLNYIAINLDVISTRIFIKTT